MDARFLSRTRIVLSPEPLRLSRGQGIIIVPSTTYSVVDCLIALGNKRKSGKGGSETQ